MAPGGGRGVARAVRSAGGRDSPWENLDGDAFGDEGDEDHSALYFSVSLWRAKRLLGNNSAGGGKKTSDPYILVKYGDQELKTRVIMGNLDPVWRSHVMFAYVEGENEVELFVFDYENFSSDDLLGKVSVMLPDPLPEEPVFTVLDRARGAAP